MSKLMIALFVTAGLGFVGTGAAQTYSPKTASTPMSKDSYTMAKKNADAQYKIDKDACSSLSGNAKDICVAEAKGKDSVAKAEAEAGYKNTAKARENARIAHAQAKYDVAIEKCDDLVGNPKDVCIKEAKAALVKGKADAKVDRVAADTRKDAATKQADARKDANADKRDADYKVAIEKCDALAGTAKDACVSNAKVQYGKP
jgi:cell division septum initiation protein DivIVA